MSGKAKRAVSFLSWTAKRQFRILKGKAGLAYAKVAFWTPTRYPDFIGIGAPRSATTWLHHWLSQHPDICMSAKKEIHFFDEPKAAPFDYGVKIKPKRSAALDLDDAANWRWYASFFRDCGAGLAGEITPDYCLIGEQRVGIIKSRIPDLKLIFMMRNPITRAWSSVRKELWRRYEMRPKDVPSPDVLVELAMQPAVLLRGDYPATIERWERHFEGKILYLFYDDVVAAPVDVLNRVCEFLGVDPTRFTAAQGQDSRVNDVPVDQIPVEVRRALEAHYEPAIRLLEAKFGRDLSHWLGSADELPATKPATVAASE